MKAESFGTTKCILKSTYAITYIHKCTKGTGVSKTAINEFCSAGTSNPKFNPVLRNMF